MPEKEIGKITHYFGRVNVGMVELSDTRTITASQNHPTADNKALGNYKVGDTLDGAQVTSIEYLPYIEDATYDILPAGSTGLYWADGILLKSTLTK